MKKGRVHIYSGDGHGKSPAAYGQAIMSAAVGESVMIIQFLKGRGLRSSEFISRLEPEIRLFRFEKSVDDFRELSDEKKKEEIANIKNGLNFAKKVLATGECDLLILDEVLGLVDNQIITIEELKTLLDIADSMTERTSVPCTACRYCTTHCPQGLDIPMLLELYNEHVFSGGGFIAPMRVAQLPDGKKPSACVGCRSCEAVCPQQIKISESLADFSAKLGL